MGPRAAPRQPRPRSGDPRALLCVLCALLPQASPQALRIDSAPSWIVVASVLAASVLAACLLLAGCFALLWSIYKGTKYAFSPGNALPQHLKEFLSRPQHNGLLFLSFPPSDESDVFDKLSVVTEVSGSSPQPPGASSGLGTPSGQGLPPS